MRTNIALLKLQVALTYLQTAGPDHPLRHSRTALLQHKARIRQFHDEVLKLVRNEKEPAPLWSAFPVARDFFLQYDAADLDRAGYVN